MLLPHQMLAKRLADAGLMEMSLAASEFRYHDFKSNVDLPAAALMQDLESALRVATSAEQRVKIEALLKDHCAGLFDATKEESDDWAKSPEGKASFDQLGGRRKDRRW